MRNDRLREAMAAAGLSDDALAQAVEVDPKSVWRWLNKGVVPRRVGLKTRIAKLLGVVETDIWPAPAEPEVEDETEATEEVVRAWSHRADVPKARWWAMFSQATEHIDLLALRHAVPPGRPRPP